MAALAKHFDEKGDAAIERVYEERPADYLKVIASLCSKEIELKRAFEQYSDDDLNAALIAVNAILAASSGASAGEGNSEGAGHTEAAELAADVPALPEAG